MRRPRPPRGCRAIEKKTDNTVLSLYITINKRLTSFHVINYAYIILLLLPFESRTSTTTFLLSHTCTSALPNFKRTQSHVFCSRARSPRNMPTDAEYSSTYITEVGSQRQAPAALPPGDSPGTHCIRDWVGLRAGLVGYGERKTSCPHRRFDTGPPSLQPAPIPTTLSCPPRLPPPNVG
jgi:hypothetical protein